MIAGVVRRPLSPLARSGLALALAGLIGAECGPTATTGSASSGTTARSAARASSSSGITAGSDWPTYHHNPSRDGSAPTGPAPATARVRWSVPLAAPVQAEPLVMGGQVIVASEDDTVRAFSQTTGGLRWTAHLGSPLSGSSLPCGDIDPSGITGTPVADPTRGLVWAVAFVQPGHHVLVGIRLANGVVASRRIVDPPGANPLVEQQRGALALSAGSVDVPFGGLYGDCGNYHGYVVGLSETGAGAMRSYQTPAPRAAGIWAPSGPAGDGAGDLYVASGNGIPSGGNQVTELSPSLVPIGSFSPPDVARLDNGDLDLGTTGPLLLPGGLVFQAGKTGTGYLLTAGRLSRAGAEVFSGPVCQAAFGADADAAGRIFVPCVDGLIALQLLTPAGGRPSFQVAWHQGPYEPGPPIVAGSTVWAIDPSSQSLLAFDAASGAIRRRWRIGGDPRFATLTAADGQLFLVAGQHLMAVG